jgi:hypothetical protein
VKNFGKVYGGILRVEFFGKGDFISPYKEKSIIPKRRSWRGCKSFYYKANFILHDTDFIVHGAEFIVHNGDFILHDTDFIVHEGEIIIYGVEFIVHEADFIVHELEFIVLFGECGFFGYMNQ